MMTRRQWAVLVSKVDAYWPASELGDHAAGLWYAALCGFEAEDVDVALERLVRAHDSPHIPGLGQLLRLLEGTDPASVPALREVIAACSSADVERYRGGYESALSAVERDVGPIAAAFAREVGLEQMNMVDMSFGSFGRRDLLAAWEAHVSRSLSVKRRALAQAAAASGVLGSGDARGELPAGTP